MEHSNRSLGKRRREDRDRPIGGGSSGGEREVSEHKLYVGNLDSRVTEFMIIKLFRKYGKIVREEFMWHAHGPRRGEPRGYCFVEYKTRDEAVRAKSSLDGKLLLGRPLRVRFSEEKVNYSEAEVVVDLHRYDKEAANGAAAKDGQVQEESEQSLDMKMSALKRRIQQLQEGR